MDVHTKMLSKEIDSVMQMLFYTICIMDMWVI